MMCGGPFNTLRFALGRKKAKGQKETDRHDVWHNVTCLRNVIDAKAVVMPSLRSTVRINFV